LFSLLLTPACILAQDFGSVQGRVVNSVTGDGVPSISVEIRSGRNTPLKALTDSNGAFRLTSVPFGTYGYTLQRVDGYWEGKLRSGMLTVQTIKAIEAIFEMTPWVPVDVRVWDSEEQPAEGVCVQFDRPMCGPRTGPDGRLHIKSAPFGTHTLIAWREEAAGHENEVTTFFPSALEPALAQRISVRPGATLPEYDIRLRTSRVYRIRGRVVDWNGKPALKPALVCSEPEEPEGGIATDSQVVGQAVRSKLALRGHFENASWKRMKTGRSS
jgi:hypothetical protein